MRNAIRFISIAALLLGATTVNLFSANWIGPVDVFTTQYAQNPVAGIDAAGNAVILANASDDLTNYYEVGAQLVQGVVQNINKYLPASSDTTPSNNTNAIAVNANGNAALLWIEFNSVDMNDVARGAVLTNGLWGSASTLSDPVNDNVQGFSTIGVALDNATQAIGAWSSQIQSGTAVQESQYSPPTWLPAQNVTTSSTDFLTGVEISGSPTGQAMLAWVDQGFLNTLYASYYNGTSWNTQAVSTDLFVSCEPSLIAVSMNPSNQAMLIWKNSARGIDSSFFSGGTFGSVQNVYVPSDGESVFNLAVALDNSGNAIALWTIDVPGTYQVLASRYSGGSWSAPVVLDTNIEHVLNFPNIGVDQEGNGYAVWEKDDASSNGAIFFSQYTNATNSWSGSPLLLSTSGVSSKEPYLAINALGGGVVVCSIDPPTTQTIQAVYMPNPNPNPPQNLTGSQIANRFATQTEFTNKLQWSASTTANVANYSILRDGVQIAVVLATQPLIFSDHNRKPGKLYTYEVIAVDANGLESAPAIIVLP